jgi:hypothetical protein
VDSWRGLGLTVLPLMPGWFPRLVVVVERQPYKPVPHPDDRSDADQHDPECGRNTSGGPEGQHQDPGGDGRCDQEPPGSANDHLSRPPRADSSKAAVADMRRERRVQDLDGLETEGLDAVEQPLARPEQDGNDVEGELVDHVRRQRLTDR